MSDLNINKASAILQMTIKVCNLYGGIAIENYLYVLSHGVTTLKLEDLKVLRRSPDLLNNVKIGQGKLQLITKQILFYHILGCSHFGQVRPEFFNFSFYRPDRPEFLKIEKKIKVLFFNFIFRVRSDSPKKFHFLIRYINLPIPVSFRWFPS